MIALGSTHGNLHDSLAAICRDGVPLFAVAEERLSKIKHDGGFPRRAIKACLDHAGIGIGDVDNSARVQTLRRGRNDIYCDLIGEFNALTGTPAAMNTSFNLKGEVIVNTPFDAVRTFYTAGLDALVIEDLVVRKTA